MQIENLLITIGVVGIVGSLAAMAMAWAAHRKEQAEKEWWANRGDNWHE
jgi:hypothetical protein